MSFKVNVLNFHLDYFAGNLDAISEGIGERFQQAIKEMEKTFSKKIQYLMNIEQEKFMLENT